MQIQFYKARGHDRTLEPKDLVRLRITSDSLLWINATPAAFGKLTLPKAIDAGAATCRLKDFGVRVHETFFCVAIPVLSTRNAEKTELLNLIVGQDWLCSIGEGRAIDFEEMVRHEANDTTKGNLTGTTLAAALVAEHFSRVHDRIHAINREIDRLEESVLTSRERTNTLQVMAVLRRQVSRLRELVDAYRAVIHALTRPDFLPDMAPDDKVHLEHLQAGYERLEDEVARLRDTVVASFELYATRVAQDTNRLLRTLTFFTIGIGVIGALAGIFGMNFETPLFKEGHSGFLIATVVMGAVLVGTAIVAIRSYRKP
ncbi:Mg2+ and Co2+ transporter CorA [Novosphingobium kunmingense]|uniref:Mg2+ and Co2+ transporter CorA n=1 Tax=Novosphingobium kunmingense TaxID=1211806 RepID=A0A2N0I2T3_9SPHN|nr:CorA family divalent cation transporter [Novosphingobium kunmingense]PKB25494.1 Mg2+ and Co2+ transporter CorA [Novosphingobium kunmingense]